METRNDKFPHDGGLPINLSVAGERGLEALTNPDVTFIAIYGLGNTDGRGISGINVVYAKTLEEKREFVFSYLNILVAWPGSYTTDVFYVDDMDAARRALGLELKSAVKRTRLKWIDDDSRSWVVVAQGGV